MKKKLVVMLCVAAMTATMVNGCGSSSTATDTAAEETTEAADDTAAEETTEADDTAEAADEDADQAAADNVAALIDKIYVQERTDTTDEDCKAAKEAWDALTDAQKELVEGENADQEDRGTCKNQPSDETEIFL